MRPAPLRNAPGPKAASHNRMRRTMRTLLTTTTLAAMLALGGTAWAQAPGGGAGGAQGGQAQGGAAQAEGSGAARRGTDTNPLQTGALNSDEQVRGKLASEGFSDIQAITRSGNSYQARAMQNGRPVDLTIDATTGTIRSQAAAR